MWQVLHDYTLSIKTVYDDRNFITHLLYKDMYWLFFLAISILFYILYKLRFDNFLLNEDDDVKCWRQKPQFSLSRGVVLSQSTFHVVVVFVDDDDNDDDDDTLPLCRRAGADKCRRRSAGPHSSVPWRPRRCRLQEDDDTEGGPAEARRPQATALPADRRGRTARRDAVPLATTAAPRRPECRPSRQRRRRSSANPNVVHDRPGLHGWRRPRRTQRTNAFHLRRIRRRNWTLRVTGCHLLCLLVI